MYITLFCLIFASAMLYKNILTTKIPQLMVYSSNKVHCIGTTYRVSLVEKFDRFWYVHLILPEVGKASHGLIQMREGIYHHLSATCCIAHEHTRTAQEVSLKYV